MAAFWIVAAAMAAMALAFVLVPLLRPRRAAAPSDRDANLEVLRGQRREIDADIAAGTLPADAREEALAELVGRAADDLGPESAAPAKPQARPVALAAGIAIAFPALAFGLYLWLGSPRAIDAVAAHSPQKVDEQQIVAMVESLAKKVKERPDDERGWQLLARSMASLGRYQESAEAYAHVVKLVPNDAQLLADYADVLGMAQGRRLAGKPAELIRQALAIDPVNHKALALAASEAADGGRIEESVRHWEKLKSLLEPGSEDARQVDAIIAQVRGMAGDSRQATVDRKPDAKPASAAVASAVSGTVTLAKDLAGKLKGDEALFVFARAEGGPKVPLAVVRTSARELPLKFALDDSHAMAPGMNLSSAKAVRIEARVSRSGNAQPQSGDLVGTSAVIAPGTRDVGVTIDKVLP